MVGGRVAQLGGRPLLAVDGRLPKLRVLDDLLDQLLKGASHLEQLKRLEVFFDNFATNSNQKFCYNSATFWSNSAIF